MLAEILLVLITAFITIYFTNTFKFNRNLPLAQIFEILRTTGTTRVFLKRILGLPNTWSSALLWTESCSQVYAMEENIWTHLLCEIRQHFVLGLFKAIVLNDVKLIKAALNLDALYGRPRLPNFLEISKDKGLTFSDGKAEIEQRKFVVDSFKELGVVRSKMEFSMQEEMRIFLADLRKKCRNQTRTNNKETINGNSIQMKIKHFFHNPVINSLWVVMASKRFDEESATLGNILDLFAKAGDTNTTKMAQLSWFFPLLSNALIFFGLNKVVNSYKCIQNRIKELIEEQRADYVPGQPKNFTHAYFDKVAQTSDPQSSFHESNAHHFTTTDIFGAAIDTTTTSLDWLLLHLARNERIQRKLQAEIDSVVGLSDLPSCIHRPRMPYTEAVIHELLRISSVVPLGVFGRALEDIDFHGYRIPKDTMVVANQFGVHHDPDVWEEPEKFKPERFLTENGKLNKLHTNLVPFGYGKRICIGENFARDQLFIFITSFFQKFSVKCTNEIPSVEGDFGLVILPKPFKLVITERFYQD